MKRAKIMLMTIAVMATVGTALAFKVSVKDQAEYCYLRTTQEPDQGGCTSEASGLIKFQGTNNIQYYYTTKTDECNKLTCTFTANELAGE